MRGYERFHSRIFRLKMKIPQAASRTPVFAPAGHAAAFVLLLMCLPVAAAQDDTATGTIVAVVCSIAGGFLLLCFLCRLCCCPSSRTTVNTTVAAAPVAAPRALAAAPAGRYVPPQHSLQPYCPQPGMPPYPQYGMAPYSPYPQANGAHPYLAAPQYWYGPNTNPSHPHYGVHSPQGTGSACEATNSEQSIPLIQQASPSNPSADEPQTT